MGSGVLLGSAPHIKAGDTLHRLPKEHMPLRQWLALLPCRHCGKCGGCDCEDWLVMMAGEVQNEER